MRAPLLFPIALLLGCAPPSEPAQSAAGAPEIEGRYVVAYVNEAPPVIGIEGSEPTVAIDARRIHFSSQCIYADWSYRRDGERLDTGSWDYGGELVAMCARALAPGEAAIQAAIDGASEVRFVQGGLWLSGEGGTVQLRRVPDPAAVAARAVDLTGEWRVAAIDGRDLAGDYGIALSADFDRVWWEPGCAAQFRDYTITGSAFAALPRSDRPEVVCEIGVPPEVMQIWSALDAADTIRRTEANGVEIAGGGRSVLLFSQ